MFKVTWDKETGGVLLGTKVTKETLGISPRPVWYEELDLLELDKLGWSYPRCEEPLLWAINKQYFYKGELAFEAKGANIYDSPTIKLRPGYEVLELEPVDVKTMLERNADLMFLLESEAIEFIRDTFTQYSRINNTFDKAGSNKLDFDALAEKAEKKTKQKMAVVREDCDSFDIMPLEAANAKGKKVVLSTRIDRFIASFSGGKDSQVVLDLCTRAMPPTAFEVIYSDTGYELPPSLELYEEVKRYYGERFPALKFTTTRNHESVLNYWDKIGTPSDTHRWCCSVMKTAPLYRSLKVDGNKQAKVLAFEGVRAEESSRRSGYNRIGKGVKHSFVINARPIFDWSNTEIFLYLMLYDLPINQAYRNGKPRVGCIFCPFGSPWDDMIVKRCYDAELRPFLSAIEKIVNERRIPNADEYIKERRWKLRASGTNVKNRTNVKISSNQFQFEAEITNSQKSVIDWLPVLCQFSLMRRGNQIFGELEYEGRLYSYKINFINNKSIFIVEDGNDIRLRYFLRKIVFKSAYCINCEACEIECPTGALSVYPKVLVDYKKCIHCLKCIDFHQHGCIVADSLVTTLSNNNMTKITPYGTFGIQDGWVDEFFIDPQNFWSTNSLGKKQVPSFKAWLKDAEIINQKGELTELGCLLSEIKEDNHLLVWEIIYINLCYNNPLMKWFIKDIPFEKAMKRSDIETMILDCFNGQFSKSSILYALSALLQVFKYSPIGLEFEQFVSDDTKSSIYIRKQYNDLSLEAVAYSLYRYAQILEVDMIRVSDLYKQDTAIGLYREFGISRNELIKKLRALQSGLNRVLTAELNMGLEHISFHKNMSPIQVLKMFTE